MKPLHLIQLYKVCTLGTSLAFLSFNKRQFQLIRYGSIGTILSSRLICKLLCTIWYDFNLKQTVYIKILLTIQNNTCTTGDDSNDENVLREQMSCSTLSQIPYTYTVSNKARNLLNSDSSSAVFRSICITIGSYTSRRSKGDIIYTWQ